MTVCERDRCTHCPGGTREARTSPPGLGKGPLQGKGLCRVFKDKEELAGHSRSPRTCEAWGLACGRDAAEGLADP